MITDIPEALDDDPFPLETRGQIERAHVTPQAADLSQGKENPASGRFRAPLDAALLNGFCGHATKRVDVLWRERRIGVGDPPHFTGTGCEVGRRDVETGTDEILFEELEGESAGDPLELALREFVGRDLHPALCAAERHVGDGAFVGHESCESHHLVLVDHGRVTDAALGRQHVVAVFGPPRVKTWISPLSRLIGKVK